MDNARKAGALVWLCQRCNEMDITEQLLCLGDACRPYEALLELSQVVRQITQAIQCLQDAKGEMPADAGRAAALLEDALRLLKP